jgi:hypothetical protein
MSITSYDEYVEIIMDMMNKKSDPQKKHQPLKIFGETHYFDFDVQEYIVPISMINLMGTKAYEELLSNGFIFPHEIAIILLNKFSSEKRNEKIEETLKPQ